MKTLFIIALLISLGIGTYYFVFSKKPAQSVAVIPFKAIGADPDHAFLIDGMTEGILTSLAQQEGISVSARESSFRIRDDARLEEIGSKLGVQAIIDGAVKIDGDRIQVTVHVINVEDAMQLWSGRYEGTMKDILSLQDEIANNIANQLLSSSRHVTSQRTPSKEAYEHYLKGRVHWNLRSLSDLHKGIDEFNNAIQSDPRFGAAYAGLSDCYTVLGYLSHLAPRDAFPKAFEAATKALELDSTLAEAHATLGYYKFYYEWDWAEAEQEFRKALSLNPNHELVYDWYGYYLTAMQRYDEARAVFNKAASLDPLSSGIGTDVGFGLYYSKQYDEAAGALKAVLEGNPKFSPAHLWLGRVYQAKKMYDQSIDEYRKMLEGAPTWPVAYAQIGSAYGVSGRPGEARIIIDSLNSFSAKKYVTSYGVALVYAGLGEYDSAYHWLDKAFEERSHWLVWLRTDPRWDAIRADPRFKELLARISLPDVNN